MTLLTSQINSHTAGGGWACFSAGQEPHHKPLLHDSQVLMHAVVCWVLVFRCTALCPTLVSPCIHAAGVLKSLSFLFEYIGEMGKDYIYAVTPLLEDALMDRDLVHRQTACTTVKRMTFSRDDSHPLFSQ